MDFYAKLYRVESDIEILYNFLDDSTVLEFDHIFVINDNDTVQCIVLYVKGLDNV